MRKREERPAEERGPSQGNLADVVDLASQRAGQTHEGALAAEGTDLVAGQAHLRLAAQQRESHPQPLRTGTERGRDGQLEDRVVVEPRVTKALDVLVGDPVRVSANDVEIVRDGGVIGAAREGSVARLHRRGGLTVDGAGR